MALKVDWPVLKSLYARGYNSAQISKQTGVPASVIRQHIARDGWKESQAKVDTMLYTDESVQERGRAWVLRMMDLCEAQMMQLRAKCNGKVGIKALDTLVRVTNVLDQIARRTFRLDDEKASGSTVNIQVNVREPGAGEIQRKIIEVDAVDSVPKVDNSTAEKCPAPQISEKASKSA